MNIVEKLRNDEFTMKELLKCLESSNPIVLYAAISCIVRNHVTDETIINQLMQCSQALGSADKMLGYYKLGHVAMGGLLALGIDETLVFQNDLDSFDKEIAIQFSKNDW